MSLTPEREEYILVSERMIEHFRDRQTWLLAAIVALQAVLAVALNYYTRDFWPRDDEIVFLTQGLSLRAGNFPMNPARPLFYPFLLSIGMKAFGLEFFWLRLFQAAGLCASTLLLYRLARVIAGRKISLVTVLVFMTFIDGIFYANRFYRESVTMLLLLLTLNLVQYMIEESRRLARAIYAGAASGLLVMIKPEFGFLMALLALGGLAAAVRAMDFRSHLLPWLVCGLMALVTASPAVLAWRAALGEWIFICSNSGNYYASSYCGSLDTDEPGDRDKRFYTKDLERFNRTKPLANQIFHYSDPSIPFNDRNRWLLNKTRECIRDNPLQSAYMLLRRALGVMFWPNKVAVIWIRNGDFGPGWPAPLVQSINLIILVADFLVILMLGPGLLRLARTRAGRVVLLTVVWVFFYYSLGLFRIRLRTPAWPLFVMAAVLGISEARNIMSSGSIMGRAALVSWLGSILVGLLLITLWLLAPVTKTGPWKKINIGEGLPQEQRGGLLFIMADELVKAGRADLMDGQLADFIRDRKSSLSSRVLIDTGDEFFKNRRFAAARFFFEMAEELEGGGEEAVRRLELISSMRKTDRIKKWRRLEEEELEGVDVFAAPLPGPVIADRDAPPLDMRLKGPSREYEYNAGLEEGKDIRPWQWTFRGAVLFITLPAGEQAPDGQEAPVLEYYATPEEER
jgi:4-amino-4-deoxy-L-arabinose transferase-like glycosyltransferase